MIFSQVEKQKHLPLMQFQVASRGVKAISALACTETDATHGTVICMNSRTTVEEPSSRLASFPSARSPHSMLTSKPCMALRCTVPPKDLGSVQ